MDNKGQTTLETLIAFPVGIAAFTLIFSGLASIWSVFWIDYQIQEAVICLSDENAYKCHLKHQRIMQNGAHFIQIDSLVLQKRTHQLYGKIEFHFPMQKKSRFDLEKVIPWPLR